MGKRLLKVDAPDQSLQFLFPQVPETDAESGLGAGPHGSKVGGVWTFRLKTLQFFDNGGQWRMGKDSPGIVHKGFFGGRIMRLLPCIVDVMPVSVRVGRFEPRKSGLIKGPK